MKILKHHLGKYVGSYIGTHVGDCIGAVLLQQRYYVKPILFCAGAIIATNAHEPALAGIAVCWLGLFGPGILMIYGLLPWWVQFRQFGMYRRFVTCIHQH